MSTYQTETHYRHRALSSSPFSLLFNTHRDMQSASAKLTVASESSRYGNRSAAGRTDSNLGYRIRPRHTGS